MLFRKYRDPIDLKMEQIRHRQSFKKKVSKHKLALAVLLELVPVPMAAIDKPIAGRMSVSHAFFFLNVLFNCFFQIPILISYLLVLFYKIIALN